MTNETTKPMVTAELLFSTFSNVGRLGKFDNTVTPQSFAVLNDFVVLKDLRPKLDFLKEKGGNQIKKEFEKIED